VRLHDRQPAALGAALRRAATRPRGGHLLPSLEAAGLAACDFVVEAAVEDLETKQGIFAALDAALPAGAVLASNTSSLPVDALAARTARPDRVIGMHFFNPVHRMPLVEIVVGPRTAPATTRAAVAFARRLGKTPVVVRDGPGFLVNRLLMFYAAEALWLLDEGHRVEDVDRAMVEWGMPMGPLRLADEVGLDVAARVGHLMQTAFGERLQFPPWLDRLPAAGRLGLKNGRGVYRYRGRHARGVDPAVYREAGLRPDRRPPDLGALAERMVLPMVNEAARCLDEAIVAGAGTLDLALVFGIGVPPFRGGLCRWADARGLPALIDGLARLAAEGNARLTPSAALRRFARAGGFYAAAPG
jgi:3-hydroxyacyl-CoA dehydrogenase/enoyl-CoA hydratase/3-hydroxybutyryl-CoA epimerase